MKPRQESEQWTWEDLQIWIRVAERFGSWLTGLSCQSDSRDADLMLKCQEARQLCKKLGHRHCIIAYSQLACPGFDDMDLSLNEMGLSLRIPKL